MTTATTLAADVRAGKRSAREVVDEALATVEARDGEYHAFLSLLPDEARAAAAVVDATVAAGNDPGPLAGVPVALKDNLCTRGAVTTCGSKILEGWHPPYSATVVEALRRAGAIALGKTNMDEFAMGSSTENSAFGATRNPRDVTKVPGGSSGGSAAAVAAGFTPLALGSDTGGSIRQPAALCGVVGMKPTYGRVSRYGLVAFASSLDQIGPFATTVEDAALLFDVLAGHDPLDSTSLPSQPEPALATVRDGVEGIRVGLCRDLLDGCAPDVIARVREAADALAGAGAKVEEVSVPEFGYGLTAYYLIAPAEASSNLARYDGVRYGLRVPGRSIGEMYENTRAEGFGAEVRRRVMIGTYVLSAGYYDAYYLRAQKVRTLIKQDFEQCFAKGVNAILTPATPSAAFGIGEKGADPVEMYLNDIFTVTVNMAGLPGIAVPAGKDAQGLPLGLQLIGRPFDEETLFSLGEVIEQAAGRFTPPRWW
ncbi:MAG TPA: Asp-tRNA(Asn)/Glu-tRNA(Gln) amidotransferase subunit GatA [Acidimicrobiales bacterium]|nr:Asp-tRNA(Asn)/Glu-tRNA(Gln) amidotransferase subunit GatA [Acidimicrobiales bacterium]